LEFDHLPGTTKVGSIANLKGRIPNQALLDEIAKCEIVCANCHAIRTVNRQNDNTAPDAGSQTGS